MLSVTEVLPGLHRMWFPGIDNNAYLIGGDEPTLIDCGPPKGGPKVLASAGRFAGGLENIRHVAVTHHHTDHTGNLATVVAMARGATVYVHSADAEIVRTGAERPRGQHHDLVGRIMLALAAKSSRAEAAPVHEEVADGDELPAAGGLRCIHTPGHTGGHVSYLWPQAGGVLFVGDAAVNMWRRLNIAQLNEDDAVARGSFRKLAELDFRVAVFGHGSPIRERAATRFRRRLDRVAGTVS